MTNGVAFVFDSGSRFEQRYNPELVKIQRVIEPSDSHLLCQLILEHAKKIGSSTAWDILENWSLSLLTFWKVEPGSKSVSASSRPAPLSSNQPLEFRA